MKHNYPDRRAPPPPKRERKWSDDDTATLTALWGKVRSQEIAATLKRSNNSVIGKANRLGLKPINYRTRMSFMRAGLSANKAQLVR